MQITQNRFRNRRILIWGYGREGKSTEHFLKTYCSPARIDIYEGSREGVRDMDYDDIFVSPGIRFEEDAPAFGNAKFTSQTEVFLEEYGAQTIGITGTKGKSTTCSLLHAALSACGGRKVFLVGNIGKPCFDVLADMDEDSLAVFELSCHQCQRLQAAPHIAVFLNLYEDHLDRYGTMGHYFDAKCGITRGQTREDILLVGPQVPEMETKAHVIRLGAGGGPAYAGRNLSAEDAETGPSMEEKGPLRKTAAVNLPAERIHEFTLRIPGEHNQFNAAVVRKIAVDLLGCEEAAVRAAMSDFPGLPHRLEHCGTIGGVDWYDDSISTIPQAAIQAVTSVPHAKTVLIGGMDRGVDYTVLEEFIREHPELNFILAYASGERILRELAGTKAQERPESAAARPEAETAPSVLLPDRPEDPGSGEAFLARTADSGGLHHVYYVADLAAQVRLAGQITPAGSAVIMSNAAASYGYFRDFEARGEEFKRLIREEQMG